jgi:two-component system repressor protein LuxO
MDREGAAKRANGGTLFLDELTEMPVALQSKLLRFIQEGTFSPVGSSEVIKTNIRFVCATNRNPFEAINRGILREDL